MIKTSLRRIVSHWLLWVAAAALPLHAATAMAMASWAAEPAQAVTVMPCHEGAVADLPALNGQSAQHKACAVCATCSAWAAIPVDLWVAVNAGPLPHSPSPAVSAPPVEFLTGGPLRPPRTFS